MWSSHIFLKLVDFITIIPYSYNLQIIKPFCVLRNKNFNICIFLNSKTYVEKSFFLALAFSREKKFLLVQGCQRKNDRQKDGKTTKYPHNNFSDEFLMTFCSLCLTLSSFFQSNFTFTD